MIMKNLKLIFITLILFLSFSLTSNSQSQVILGIGGALPIGDFAGNDISNDAQGGAAAGLNLNLNYSYYFSENGLGLFGGLDICYNWLTDDVKKAFKTQFESAGILNADYRFFKYINIPVSAGFSYRQKVKDGVSLFTNFGLAGDFLKLSDLVISINNQEIIMNTQPDIRLGFKIGGGFIIGKTSVSINYLDLGKHKLNATMSTTGNSQVIKGNQKVGILTITLGFVL